MAECTTHIGHRPWRHQAVIDWKLPPCLAFLVLEGAIQGEEQGRMVPNTLHEICKELMVFFKEKTQIVTKVQPGWLSPDSLT